MSYRDKIFEMLKDSRPVRATEFRAAGIPTIIVSRMAKAGEIEASLRGVYRLPGVSTDATHSLIAEFTAAHPGSVVCLVTAARYHGLNDDMQSPWTFAIPGTGKVKIPDGCKLLRWTKPEFYELGVVDVMVEGVKVRMTDEARTVADMFRSWNRYPEEQAHVALATYLKKGNEPEKVAAYARKLGFAKDVARIAPVLRQMLEAGAFGASEDLDFKF